ncbi:MAG: phosphate acyltransferase PlsX [Gammaproteobacteria bacterium]|nr:phosphate acyltransferase PlsX [Gammaproteobacteria bacterium]
MGGDLGHTAAVAGAVRALESTPELQLILVGDGGQLKPDIEALSSAHRSRIKLEHTTEVVAMDQSPRQVLRNKKPYSMRLALEMITQGRAQACLSSGNTGALVALSKAVLGTVQGIKRPAILSPIPSLNGVTLMLDLGANATCAPALLCQFAVMGDVVARGDYNIARPSVGLLNIGTEQGKGTELLNEADAMLRESALNYVGFIEGNHIFTDAVDVVVSDGFTGNIALKTMEGFAQFFAARLSESGRTHRDEAGSSLTDGFMQILDTRTHNGASLVGLDGIVVKSHGSADATAIFHAIEMATKEIHSHIPREIERTIAQYKFPAGELHV